MAMLPILSQLRRVTPSHSLVPRQSTRLSIAVLSADERNRLFSCRWVLHVETPQTAPITNVEPAMGDNGIGPGLAWSLLGWVWRSELTHFVIRLGDRLHQGHFAISPINV